MKAACMFAGVRFSLIDGCFSDVKTDQSVML